MKELNNIKNNGFKTPNDYFETIEDSILTNIKLDTISKESGFTLTDNYFEKLTIQNNNNNNNDPKVISLLDKKVLLTLTSVAAAVILCFSLIFPQKNPILKNIENEFIENYVINELSNDELELLIADLDLSETDFINYELNYPIIESAFENDNELEFYDNFDLSDN